VRDAPPNKGMKQTKRGQLRSFAAYPRCSADMQEADCAINLSQSPGKLHRQWRANATLCGLSVVLVFALPSHSTQAEISTSPCKYEENCQCRAPGVTARWKAVYCMYLNETDDFENGGVQRCLARAEPASVVKSGACEQNAYWKKKLCRAMHTKEQDIRNCIQDREMIPRFVEKGAGG
jgi:hypothetical protein